MPLIAATIKQQAAAQLFAAFQREFVQEMAVNDQAQAHYQKMANAISDVIITIVTALQTQAQVAPGTPVATAGSPAAQVGSTVGVGVIL